MPKFQPGERARIVNVDPSEKSLIGTECTVVKLLSEVDVLMILLMHGLQFVNQPVYVCETRVGQVYFSECALAKLLPPGSDICRELARKALEDSPQEEIPCALS